jgi:hypothetical protein
MYKSIIEDQISNYPNEDLETYLHAMLTPVSLRTGFMEELRLRLLQEGSVKSNERRYLKYAVLGIAGVLSSIILVITGIRATFTLIGAVRIFSQVRDSVRKDAAAQLKPAA